MDWWLFAICAVTLIGAGEVVALGALLGLGYQALQWAQTGKWPSYVLGAQLDIPVDFQPTHWVVVDRLIHYLLFDVEAALVALICAGLALPIKEWLGRDRGSVVRPARLSGAPAGPSGVPRYSAPAPVTPTRNDPLPPPELGLLGRLGVFLGWLFTAAALLCGAIAVLVFVNKGVPIFGWAALASGGAVWLFGRGVRYVLVGPTGNPEPAGALPAERLSVPRVPVRPPPASPWGSRH